jgi:hypothetical protein
VKNETIHDKLEASYRAEMGPQIDAVAYLKEDSIHPRIPGVLSGDIELGRAYPSFLRSQQSM